MFFYLSKIFWLVAAPLNFIWLLLGAGLALRLCWPKVSNRILLCALGLFLVFGILPVGHNMTVWLERQYARPDPMPADVDGLIVLGGMFNEDISAATGMNSGNGNLIRLTDFIELSNKYPKATKIFTGGSGRLMPSSLREADHAESFLSGLDLPTKDIIFENDSRNSYENAMFSRELAQPKAGETWLVITSASHMPRVMGVFAKAEWAVTAYPSNPKTDGRYRLNPFPLNVSHQFYLLQVAMKEIIGTVSYYLTAKSAFLLPPPALHSGIDKDQNLTKGGAE